MTPFYYRKRQPRPWPAVGLATLLALLLGLAVVVWR